MNCINCGDVGWTTEQDPNATREDAEPIQVQCNCYGILILPLLSESELKEGWEIKDVNSTLMKVLSREKLLGII